MPREYKQNVVKVDLSSYLHYWRGIKKIGKSSLFKDLLLLKYDNLKKGLLLSIGNEDGHNSLDGISYDVAPDWDTFMEISDDLVENRTANDFQLLALDTVDELVRIAGNEVMKQHKRKKGLVAESLNACFGGYGAGRQKIREMIDERLALLKRAGYGIIMIGHTKLKDIKEKDGTEYQQLTSSLSNDYDSIFSDKADIIMTISTDKVVTENHLSSVKRFMNFRDDGFMVDCGSRFPNMPDRLELSVENYLKAFEQGVLSAMIKPLSEKELEEALSKELKQKEQNAAEFREKIIIPTNEVAITEIKNISESLDKVSQTKLLKILKANEISSLADPKKIPNENLLKALKEIKKLAKE